MHYRSLGVDGPSASALCLGAMTFGTSVDEETATAILDRFTEAGGTFIDTSNNYAFWAPGANGFESEELLGRWIARRGNRDDLVLATKVGARPVPGLPFPEHIEGLSARAVREAAEGSLRRLGTDRLDLYYAHVTDPATPVEETMGAFAALVADGKAAALGCSNHAPPSWRTPTAARPTGVGPATAASSSATATCGPGPGRTSASRSTPTRRCSPTSRSARS